MPVPLLKSDRKVLKASEWRDDKAQKSLEEIRSDMQKNYDKLGESRRTFARLSKLGPSNNKWFSVLGMSAADMEVSEISEISIQVPNNHGLPVYVENKDGKEFVVNYYTKEIMYVKENNNTSTIYSDKFVIRLFQVDPLKQLPVPWKREFVSNSKVGTLSGTDCCKLNYILREQNSEDNVWIKIYQGYGTAVCISLSNDESNPQKAQYAMIIEYLEQNQQKPQKTASLTPDEILLDKKQEEYMTTLLTLKAQQKEFMEVIRNMAKLSEIPGAIKLGKKNQNGLPFLELPMLTYEYSVYHVEGPRIISQWQMLATSDNTTDDETKKMTSILTRVRDNLPDNSFCEAIREIIRFLLEPKSYNTSELSTALVDDIWDNRSFDQKTDKYKVTYGPSKPFIDIAHDYQDFHAANAANDVCQLPVYNIIVTMNDDTNQPVLYIRRRVHTQQRIMMSESYGWISWFSLPSGIKAATQINWPTLISCFPEDRRKDIVDFNVFRHSDSMVSAVVRNSNWETYAVCLWTPSLAKAGWSNDKRNSRRVFDFNLYRSRLLYGAKKYTALYDMKNMAGPRVNVMDTTVPGPMRQGPIQTNSDGIRHGGNETVFESNQGNQFAVPGERRQRLTTDLVNGMEALSLQAKMKPLKAAKVKVSKDRENPIFGLSCKEGLRAAGLKHNDASLGSYLSALEAAPFQPMKNVMESNVW